LNQRNNIPDPITIPWHSAEGRRRLFESRFNKDFFQLAHRFQPQIKPTYCGVASAVTVMNALRIPTGLRIDSGLDVAVPVSHGGGSMQYNSYSQLTLLNEYTDMVKCREKIEGVIIECETTGDVTFEPGLNLRQLAQKLKIYLLNVDVRHAVDSDTKGKPHPITRFRQDLMAYLNDSSTFMVVNYYGHKLEKNVGGHFSPVAAYHEPSDSVLVMDVAGHKHPWFWVSVRHLFEAMMEKDEGEPRGYMLISDKLRH
jgi:hypothetical protein